MRNKKVAPDYRHIIVMCYDANESDITMENGYLVQMQ